jgi:hypothetical protein
MMGFSSSSREGPHKCFNGQNIWHFGWFSDRTISVDPFQGVQLVELAPFVDYDRTYSNQAVLVSIFDIHLVYNRAKGFNSETSEYGNTVTVTQEKTEINSALLGALDMNESKFIIQNYMDTGRTLRIEVCKSSIGTSSADYMLLSIGLGDAMCPTTPVPASKVTPHPTATPTDAWTWAPTYRPTEAPTYRPTEAPTYRPTEAPSLSPTVKLPMIVLSTPTPSVSKETPDLLTLSPSIGPPENDAIIPSQPPKKPNLYDRPRMSPSPSPGPLAIYQDVGDLSGGEEEDEAEEDAINAARNPLKPNGETVAMIFCAASLALFTTCCMLAVFRWNQRRIDDQRRNLRILEYSASSDIKLYMQDPV